MEPILGVLCLEGGFCAIPAPEASTVLFMPLPHPLSKWSPISYDQLYLHSDLYKQPSS